MFDQKPIKVFYSYSHKDELLRDKLEEHLAHLKRQKIISEWHDRKITAGSDLEEKINENLNSADVILLLLSPSFLASDYCSEKEMVIALEKHKKGEARAIAAILRPCEWQETPFKEFLVLPKDGLPITKWADEDDAFLDVAKGIRKVVEEIRGLEEKTIPSNENAENKVKPFITLPSPTVSFVTRHDHNGENLIEKIGKSLAESDNNLVVLWGSGGNGKTTLAAQFARASEKERQIVWIDADGRTDISAGVLLDEIVTQLGQPEIRQLPPTLKHEQSLNLLTEKPSLVILDNFETLKEEYQKECLEFLKLREFDALITTRERIQGVKNENVFEMTEKEASAFIERLIEDSPFPQAFSEDIRQKTMETAERNPLVIQWIIGQIDNAQSPKEVFDELEHGEGEAAERVFNRSFNLPQLGSDGRSILLALSLFVLNARRRSVKDIVVFGKDVRRFNSALKSLANLRLINVTEGSERLFLGGLTRQFARAYLEKSGRFRLFCQKFIEYFLEFATRHSKASPENLNLLEEDKINLLSAIDLAFDQEDSGKVFILAGALPEFLDIRGHWEDAILIFEKIIVLARSLNDNYHIWFFSAALGIIYAKRADFDKADKLFNRSLGIARELKNQEGISSALNNLGALSHIKGNLEKAEMLYEESLEIDRTLKNPAGVAGSLNNLALVLEEKGSLERAERLLRESLEIGEKIRDFGCAGKTLHSFGILEKNRGEFEKAKIYFDRSEELFQQLGEQAGMAELLNSKAELYFLLRDLNNAEKFCNESLNISDSLQLVVTIYENKRLKGKISRVRGNLNIASELYAESLSKFRELGYELQVADTLIEIAALAEINGKNSYAIDLLCECVEILERMKSSKLVGALESLKRLKGVSTNN
jgi:tetratricopeptide (TPR) repeat protein